MNRGLFFPLDFNSFHTIPKPPIPYVEGYEFSVVEHFPVKPKRSPDVDFTTTEYERRTTQELVHRCVRRSPKKGTMGTRELGLKVFLPLRIGDNEMSQVALVEVTSGHLAGMRVVAKLYDPLYYDHATLRWNPFSYVEADYAREVAAYRHLHEDNLGEYIPQLYGSYSTSIVHPGVGTRAVRLILVEYIHGTSMYHLAPNDFPEEVHRHIMYQIVKAESQFYAVDVRHGDLYQRNVIISGEARHDPNNRPRVTIIDFGRANIGRAIPRLLNWSLEPRLLPGVYVSPILRWHRGITPKPNDFAMWCMWAWNEWLCHEFRDDIPAITPEMERWVPDDVRGNPFFIELFGPE
ncbi:uncharacterized protein BO97DRAFT_352472 [Aspergillus homomorphus CBS 101889]|uniref:Protein kinase domain-containing protein n=1 Tax=Aspergillus homomorphus (strain CBS 101889) TaxID=1450537 RepID=A0A395HPN3_ASPHC|nr:hypothetical protein BO97DRAFT_352472 [Aspergillus homomorphus CBS 101889]RAL09225.1 hypothetical protein BO97DRAFT_352472 [Aspergillus homomorphus CBS 101889]